jgi:GT2 family glycosyltransferase
MSPQHAAVVILNYNGKQFLERFLPGVLAHSAPHKVYVADNCSTDDSLLYLKENFPTVPVISNNGNFGYAQGYNLALQQVFSEYAVLLNNDVEVTSGWLDPIIALMDSNPRIAACQPLIIDHAKKDVFEYAGAAGGYIDSLGYPFCRGRIFNTLEENKGQYDINAEIFWASGAAMCVRMSAFGQAGGFDADYFAHMEEIDLCWRMKNLGYKIMCCGSSRIYHIGGGTLSKISNRKTFLNFRNNLATLTKNNPPYPLILKLLLRLVLDGVAGIKFLAEGQPRHCLAVVKAHFSFYSQLPALVRKRRTLRATPGFRYNLSNIYRGSIVLAYHLFGRHRFSQLRNRFSSEKHQ